MSCFLIKHLAVKTGAIFLLVILSMLISVEVLLGQYYVLSFPIFFSTQKISNWIRIKTFAYIKCFPFGSYNLISKLNTFIQDFNSL